jgi:hypothetical protein
LRPKWYPPELDYLKRWLFELHGRSGASNAGLAPLSWTQLNAWIEATGNIVHPWEKRALMELDAVLLNPGSLDEKD